MKLILTVVFSLLLLGTGMLVSMDWRTPDNGPGKSNENPEQDQGATNKPTTFGECHARVEYDSYHRGSQTYQPSKRLIEKLRQYEDLHARCTLENMSTVDPDCRYVVWVAPFGFQGLGNKMLSLASTFLYALLTNRVLYIVPQENMDQLFCEPFPRSSWLLPESSKYMLEGLNNTRLGKVLKTSTKCNKEVLFPSLAYSYLSVDYDEGDETFFCEDMQDVLSEQVKWLFLRSNVYFVPGLLYVPDFREELQELFPHPQATFHHLSRYLFHPSNSVWDQVTNYYDTNLKHADSLIGIQIRVTGHARKKRKNYPSRVLQCALETGLLPGVGGHSVGRRNLRMKREIAGLVASLDVKHFELFRDLYINSPTVDGSSVTIYQPSHEGTQKTGNLEHDEKALMDIYLLSLSNELITSPGSTFGYIAQGVGGLRPWLMSLSHSTNGGGDLISWLMSLLGSQTDTSACQQSSMEPCFFSFDAPKCSCKSVQSEAELDIQVCEDASGKKLQPM